MMHEIIIAFQLGDISTLSMASRAISQKSKPCGKLTPQSSVNKPTKSKLNLPNTNYTPHVKKQKLAF